MSKGSPHDPGRSESKSVILFLLLVLTNVLILAPVDLAQAALPPFDVHRSTDSASVRSAPLHARVSTSPLDDEAGILEDGTPYFYTVTDAVGDPVAISADKNVALGTVRIAFDDADALSASALVQADASTVEASPAAIPADGVTASILTIVPRDGSGQALGMGLAISIGASQLWPGSLWGGVIDRSNGTYVAKVVSATPGAGTVWVTVEGVVLDDTPTITFEDTDPSPLSFLERAIALDEALTGVNGSFDLLLDELTGDSWGHADTGLAKALQALDLLYSPDPANHDNAQDPKLKDSIHKLEMAREGASAEALLQIDALIDELLEATRLVSLHYIYEAQTVCGGCGAGAPGKLCDAQKEYDEGQALWNSDPVEAAKEFSNATRSAQQAIDQCP